MKRIIHSAIITAGAPSRGLRLLALCALMLAAAVCLPHSLPRRAQAEQAPALKGEAAIAHLKQQGLDGSLQQALQAARGGVSAGAQTSSLAATGDFDFTHLVKLIAFNSFSPDRLGRAVAISGDTVVVGAPGSATNRGSVYVFVRSAAGYTLQQELMADHRTIDSFFGASVAISGDTIVAGAQGESGNRGGAYVFVRSGNSWSRQQRLEAGDAQAGAAFGFSVAIDGNTVVVGAPLEDLQGRSNQGAAYAFDRVGETWVQRAKLRFLVGSAGDQFGFSVAFSGNTAVIGAPRVHFGNKPDQGIAYVFGRQGLAWFLQRDLRASDGAANDFFGSSVALDGDEVVVGAPGDDIGSNLNEGSAYFFQRAGSEWIQKQKLIASVPGTPGDQFGVSVALKGGALVVGADAENVNGNEHQGSVYVFARPTPQSSWLQQKKLTANDGASGDFFGRSVAVSDGTVVAGVSGDANERGAASVYDIHPKLAAGDAAPDDRFGDAVAVSGDTVVVGAVGDDNARGSAYVFVRSGAGYSLQQKLVAADGVAGDEFGDAVAISGDTIVIGADRVNGARGAAYVFTRSGGAWSQRQKLAGDATGFQNEFGVSVAIDGDTIVIGARGDDIGAVANQGSAYVFVRSNGNWIRQQKLLAGDGSANDIFGDAVAISGETIVVGARGDDIGGNSDQGSAYVFTRSAATWSLQEKLVADDGAANDRFGDKVAISGRTIVVGASLADIGRKINQGSAYVFTDETTVWFQRQKLVARDAEADDRFGVSVAISGDTIVVGASNENRNQGSVYFFMRNPTVFHSGAKLTAADPTGGDLFGASVAISGNTFVAGAPKYSGNRGAVYALRAPANKTSIACVSAASFVRNALATESIIAAFGDELAKSVEVAASQPLPTALAGTSVNLRDSVGVERLAPLFFVSPGQINFQVPAGVAPGRAEVTVIRDGETVATGSPMIEAVSPGLFSADSTGRGPALGVALRVKADGSQQFEPIARYDDEQRRFVAAPIDLGAANDRVFLILFASGARYRSSLGSVSVQIGGESLAALYAGRRGRSSDWIRSTCCCRAIWQGGAKRN
jgi:uncharacterized protein (TIGR03437 family)